MTTKKKPTQGTFMFHILLCLARFTAVVSYSILYLAHQLDINNFAFLDL